MTTSKEKLLNKLSECVLEMEDKKKVIDASGKNILKQGYPALDGIMEGVW